MHKLTPYVGKVETNRVHYSNIIVHVQVCILYTMRNAHALIHNLCTLHMYTHNKLYLLYMHTHSTCNIIHIIHSIDYHKINEPLPLHVSLQLHTHMPLHTYLSVSSLILLLFAAVAPLELQPVLLTFSPLAQTSTSLNRITVS